MAYEWFMRYIPAAPKAVTGGIKAQNKRGAFGKTWWGKQWLTSLEKFHSNTRLTRGKTYARSGQVTDLVISADNGVSAKVQGSRANPYKVSIILTPWSKSEKKLVAEKLASKPIYIAQLISGQMPENLDRTLKTAGAPLFPYKFNDLRSKCSCPDYSNPCKHIAAVFYLMAEAFDSDPFLLLTLRGIERDQLLKQTGYQHPVEGGEESAVLPEPLPTEHGDFWEYTTLPEPSMLFSSPRVEATMIKRLGSIQYWRSSKNLVKTMEIIYARNSLSAETMINRLTTEQDKEVSSSPE
ncbi:SWIM zinc finger family protein [Chlorobium sp. KB01]|uniref:SWIM zinc finger family protein n=1 Tax=Chlorobium sp. KB01 TaxID=1917528 RepID=UPI000978288F|nr:SWIM zinc finger family protein [Chlorobium sp. KB01]